MKDLSETRKKYWTLFSLVIFFHVPADVTITTIVIKMYSIQNEANPFMRTLLQESWFLFAGANILAGIIATISFYFILKAGEELEQYKKLYFNFVGVILCFLFMFGTFVFFNNLILLTVNIFFS